MTLLGMFEEIAENRVSVEISTIPFDPSPEKSELKSMLVNAFLILFVSALGQSQSVLLYGGGAGVDRFNFP